MKTKLLLLIGLSVVFFQCSTEGELTKSPLWGVDFSAESTAAFAGGSIEQQNAESKTIYIVESGSLRETEESHYTISFIFQNGESLQLGIIKQTTDYNCHYPGAESENKLVSATFNGIPLELAESSISIQPDTGDNKLHIITKMRTINAGDFNGTLSRIPLLEKATQQ